jgi:helicase
VLDGKSLLVVAPTSSGKTMIGELSAIQAVSAGKKAAFLLPYRALVNEKFEEFTAQYGPAGLRVVRCSGDASDGIGPALSGRYDLGFFTYETFLNLALASPRLVRQLGLVVIDEGQFITDPGRGITVELILALLLRARQEGIQPQLVMLSAVLGKLNGLDDWLGLGVLSSTQRPVPLIEGVLDRRGTFQFVDADGTTKVEQLLPTQSIVQRRDEPSSQDVIVPLAQSLVAKGEKMIVFRKHARPRPRLREISREGTGTAAGHARSRQSARTGPHWIIGGFAVVPRWRDRVSQYQSPPGGTRGGRARVSRQGWRHPCDGRNDHAGGRHQHAGVHRAVGGK